MTDLVPATMKTKVVRVAMPSTMRIWFLSPPNSPRLESSLFNIVIICPFHSCAPISSCMIPYMVVFPIDSQYVLKPVKDVPVEELLSNLLVGEQVKQAVPRPH